MSQLRAIAAHAMDHPEAALPELLNFCRETLNASRAVALAFDGSDKKPRARRLCYSSDGDGRAQVLQGLSEFPCNVKNLSSSSFLSHEEVREVGEGWLDVFIGGPALLIPCAGRALGFSENSSLCSGAIVVGPTTRENKVDTALLDAVSVTAGLIFLELDRSKAQVELRKLGILNEVRDRIREHLTAEAVGQAVLTLLKKVIRYEAGVLYLLDEDPSQNEYMVFCAAEGENAKHLFNSYYPRERLGVTWRAANLRRPIVGGLEDVPEDARRSNDPAWENLSGSMHAAWALVPLVHLGRPVGVAHLEGINNGLGVSRRQYEFLQTMGATLGEAVFRWRSLCSANPSIYPSIDLIAALYSITDSAGSRDPFAFERLVHGLFLSAAGVNVLTNKSRNLPQSDVIFEIPSLKKKVVVEAKCLATAEKNIGGSELAQLIAEINAHDADVGILASCNPISSRTADAIAHGFKIIVLNLQRLQRMVALSSETRGKLINHWIDNAEPEINYLPDVNTGVLL
jgi:hypothetical protein